VRYALDIASLLASLRERLERVYGPRLAGLYLYGSYARGDATERSDVDVVVVLDRVDSYWAEIERTSAVRSDLSLEHGVGVSLVYVPEGEWRAGNTPFLANVREEARAA
jgi:predicted nucleotidyltransferase